MTTSLKQLRTITITEAVEKLNVSDDIVRKWCNAGKVRFFQAGRKGTYHIVEADLVRHVEQMLQGSAPQETTDAAAATAVTQEKASAHAFSSRRDISDLLPPPSERRFAVAGGR